MDFQGPLTLNFKDLPGQTIFHAPKNPENFQDFQDFSGGKLVWMTGMKEAKDAHTHKFCNIIGVITCT